MGRPGSRWFLGDTSEDNLIFINLVREVLQKKPIEHLYSRGAQKRADKRKLQAQEKSLDEAAE